MRKASENSVRKLVRLGRSSLAVTLPKDAINELGWKGKQKVVAKKQGKGIFITDWPGK